MCREDVFVEPLWHRIKCEKVYVKADDSFGSARKAIGSYFYLKLGAEHKWSTLNAA